MHISMGVLGHLELEDSVGHKAETPPKAVGMQDGAMGPLQGKFIRSTSNNGTIVT